MDMGSDSSMSSCKTSMVWNWYTIDACFLSAQWHVTTPGAFAATCVGVVLLVVLLEALRRGGHEYDALIARSFAARRSALAAASTTITTSTTLLLRATPVQQLGRAALHAVTFGVAYLVMLLAMSLNGYIFFCILIGAGLGKFLCDWMTMTVVLGPGESGGDGLVLVKGLGSGETTTGCCD